MKKMNVIPLFMSLFMVFSCTNQEENELNPVNETTIKSNQKENQQFLNTKNVLLYSAIAEMNELKKRKLELLDKIESNKNRKINKQNIRVEKFNLKKKSVTIPKSKDYRLRTNNKSDLIKELEVSILPRQKELFDIIDCLSKKGPKCPGPKPPIGCFEEEVNCRINLSKYLGMEHHKEDGINIIRTIIVNEKNELVGEGIIKDGRCGPKLIFDSKLKGKGTVLIELEIGNCELKTKLKVLVEK